MLRMECSTSDAGTVLCRVREFRQPDERAVGHSGDERLPDRHEAAQSAAEKTQGRQSTVLTLPTTVSIRRHFTV